MSAVQRLSMLLVLTTISLGALAQDGIHPYVEYRKRIETAQNISPLDTGLFGEQVSLYNGSTAFSVTDIDIPGNSALPVQLTRRMAIELQPQNIISSYDSLLRGIGNWDVDVPYMAASYPVSSGNALRCNGAYVPSGAPYGFQRGDVWQGISVNVPGRGGTSALGVQTQTPRPSGGATYKLTTSERDVFDCIPMAAGFTGEGFRMTSSSGLRYYFDVGASRTAATLETQIKGPDGLPFPVYVQRNRLYLLASKIEDRFGNTVQFQYNANGHPTKIWANDTREINLTYTSGRLTSATSHGRTWQYQYSHVGIGLYARLSQVTQPDGSKWQYTYTDDLMPPPGATGLPPQPWCAGMPVMLSTALTLTATHPSGAVGTFNFNNRRHYRSGVHATECMQTGDPGNPDYVLLVPHYFDVMSIDSKTISGPGLSQPLAWTYEYVLNGQFLWGTPSVPLPYPCTTCAAQKTVVVANPDNTKSRYTFGMRYHDNDGRQLKVETLRADNTVIRTETNTYMTEAEAATQPFHGEYGTILGFISDPASARIRPVTNRTITQDGVNFVWQANSFDTMARPKKVTRSSTVSSNPTRTEETTYHDNLVKWVIGQVTKVVCTAPTTPLPAGCGAGVEMFERTYDATYAMPWVTERFNKPEQTLTWDTSSSLVSGQRGTAKTVADGNGKVTTLSNWKRGTPQLIKYPGTPEASAGATKQAQVNDSGWLDWVEDENVFRTNYTYDAMGRLASIIYPTGDTPASATTTLVFQQIASAEYGIPANHWRQTVSTGNGRKIVYFDALWRPLVTREYDTADEAGTRRFQRLAYDYAGRTTFASYPGTTDALVKGTHTTYDALDRVTHVKQDWEGTGQLTTTTEYLAGFQTRVTNPRNHQTLTTLHQAFDQPTYDFPRGINHPEGAFTEIHRDIFGKPTALKRRNASGSVALTRSYAYNVNQELCRSVEPETGATLMGYDGAGNLAWSAAGLPSGTACSTTGTETAINARKAARTYDARNRLTALTFADGKGNQTWTYAPDGLQATISTVNPSAAPIVNTYGYNRRRLLVSETTLVAGALPQHQYVYNANGHLSGMVYGSGLSVDYAPNALGQPTKAGTFATAVKYHPNGGIKEFTYGNAIRHTLTQNARGLPDTSCDFYGTCSAGAFLNDGYDYDPNGNVAAISDGRTGNRGHRTMTYDALDRLTNVTVPTPASSFFGNATYVYDVLDNLTRVHVTAGNQPRNHYYCYDTNWRLTNVKTGSCGGATVMGLGYDVQGNVLNKSGQGYEFDLGNRLRRSVGKEWYAYDGHGRRVLSCTSTACDYQQYGFDGKLYWHRDNRAGKQFDNVYLGGSLVAIREQPTAGGAVSVRYQHTDALGSPVVITNESRGIVEKSEYEPYGWPANRAWRDGPGYTGHVEDAATQLTYMQQRYMDPQLGVFLSVDPVTAYEQPIGQFHRYRYANNNPYKFTDPDGRNALLTTVEGAKWGTVVCGPWCGAAGAVIGLGVGLWIGDKVVDAVQNSESQETPNQPEPGTAESDEGCIYCVDGTNTQSGKDYVGSSDDLGKRAATANDGRDRSSNTTKVDSYKKGDTTDRQNKEQKAMNDRGGVENLDNKRNEVAPRRWEDRGIDPPNK